MQVVIDDELIDQSVKQSVKKLGLVPKETLKGKTWNVEEFRHNCLGGKSRAWVKREIFDRYPETYVENGGFVVDPFPGTGRKTIIYAYDASLWVNDHYHEFNWGAK
ncbi:MAG: DUF771 domain-containing protein [Limosilactobacillus mucosae]|nr:DUF771 domain-containing protein [Limosilactobacillus mucosae]